MDALTREYHFPLYGVIGVLLQGNTAVQCGAWEEGIVTITSELTRYRTLGAQLYAPFFLSFLAEGYRRQGKIDEALMSFDKQIR
jgi:hypothetical protein